MQINISKQMAQAVIAALRLHIERQGERQYGYGDASSRGDDYTVTNVEALEFFKEVVKSA